MKAIVQDRYGGADDVRLADVDAPAIGKPTDVIVRVRAASVNAADWHGTTGDPFVVRVGMGLTRPKPRVRGMDVAGVVEAVGSGVTRWRPGDEVFGTGEEGTFAELARVREDRLARKPARASFEEAAALPVAGLTALQGLRDHAKLRAGERVLVEGAGGGVGTFAVQIAKAMGARVSAITSAASLELVRGLGADDALDRGAGDPLARPDRYDVYFDLSAARPIAACKGALAPGGRLVLVGAGTRRGWGLVARPLSGVMARGVKVFVSQSDPDDLEALAALVEKGDVRPAVTRVLPLAQAADALREIGEGRARGKLVLRV